MRLKQTILILCMIWAGSSAASPFQPTSFDYDYEVEGRQAPTRHRGKAASTTPRPLIQQYWQNFVRNLPTLPPLRWNMTNPLSNLFTAGVQQIIETPVSMHYLTEEDNQKRINSRRKKAKKNKNRKKLSSSLRNSYDDSYQESQLQLHLQPLGVDRNRVLHLYEPTSGQFYALQMETQPSFYNQYSQNNGYDGGFYDDEDNDDSYYQHNGYEDDDAQNEGYDEDYEPNSHEYTSDESDNHSAYNDGDVEVVDNWGYNDEEIFADRKLKKETYNLKALANNIINVRKDLLKPETAEDVVNQLSTDKMSEEEKSKLKIKKDDANKTDAELGRDVGGSSIKDNGNTKRKQSVKTKPSLKLINVSKARGKFYIIPGNIFS